MQVLLAGSGIAWCVAGGRAARLGAPPRQHQDTDVVVAPADVPQLLEQRAGWHCGRSTQVRCSQPAIVSRSRSGQLWLRRDASHPWVLDVLLAPDRRRWTFKKDARVTLPWDRALHTVASIA